MKKVMFLTGTRADFGHMKGLISKLESSGQFETYIFVTGMHMLSKYGSTFREVIKQGYRNVYPFMNQSTNNDQDVILSNTILGLSHYVKEVKPDMIVVHGDRVEALAGAIVGSLNNILTAHISGGELSGTIDEFMRHAITKMSHVHFVANELAKIRVMRMGEKEKSIYVIGSPEIDLMLSKDLPSLHGVKNYYEIPFDEYAIFIYHPVTTELDSLEEDIANIVDALEESAKNYVVIYPNNDPGTDIIMKELLVLEKDPKFRVLPSMRFEPFLTLLKHSKFIIGNSSCGIREAPVYGVPTINIGSRQMNRGKAKSIVNASASEEEILKAIQQVKQSKFKPSFEFGAGNSIRMFYDIISKDEFWLIPIQKQFVD